jgi:hypothetical protein
VMGRPQAARRHGRDRAVMGRPQAARTRAWEDRDVEDRYAPPQAGRERGNRASSLSSRLPDFPASRLQCHTPA